MICTMKRLPTALIPIVVLATLAAGGFASELSDLLTDAQRTYIRGDLAGAKEKFRLVQQIDPKNPTAYSYLRRIAGEEAAREAGKAAPNATQAALAKLLLEKVDFREAALPEALDYLRQRATQLSGGKQAVNFVLQLDDTARAAKVTLTLQAVPFTEVLRYIGELAGVTFVYEPYAIVVKQKGALAPETPAK